MLGKVVETRAWLGVWALVTLASSSLQVVPADVTVLPVQAVVP